MSDTLGVKITADVVDLQAKLAIAKAQMQSFTRDLNTAARTAASSGLTDTLKSSMAQSAESLITARRRVDELGASLDKAGVHVTGLREISAAMHEIASGDVSRLPFSIAKLSEEFFGLGPAALAGVAGVAALGAGLYELVAHTNEARQAAIDAAASFAFREIPESTANVVAWTQSIQQIPGATSKSASDYVNALGDMKNATTAVRQAVVALAPDLYAAFGDNSEKATAEIKGFVAQWNDIQKNGGDAGEAIRRLAADIAAAAKASDVARDATSGFLDKLEQLFVAGGGASAPGVELIQTYVDKLQEAAAAAKEAQVGAGAASAGVVAAKSDPVADFREQLAKMEAEFKGSHQAMLEEAVRLWQGESQAAGLSTAQQREVLMGLYDAEKQLNAANAEDVRQQLQKTLDAQKQAETQLATIQRDQANTELQLGRVKLQGERDTLDAQVAAGQITATKKLQIIKQLDDDEYDLERNMLQKELDGLDKALTDYKVRYQQLYDQLEILDAQHVQKMAADDLQIQNNNKKATTEFDKDWDSATNKINSDFDQMLRGVLQGTQTWQQAFTRLETNLVTSMAEGLLKMGVEEAAAQAKRLALELTTDQAMTDARIAQIAAGNVAQDTVDIEPAVMKHAGSAAAAVYDDVSQIPYVGWILAPPAAAAAFAAVASFGSYDQGTNFVPNDMIAQIHAGERIVPAADNADLISAVNGGGGGGDVYSFSINISALDGPSVAPAPTRAGADDRERARQPVATGK